MPSSTHERGAQLWKRELLDSPFGLPHFRAVFSHFGYVETFDSAARIADNRRVDACRRDAGT